MNHMNFINFIFLKKKFFLRKLFFRKLGRLEIFFVELSSEKVKNRPRGTPRPLSGAQMTFQRQKHRKSRDLVVPRTPVLSVPKNIAGEKSYDLRLFNFFSSEMSHIHQIHLYLFFPGRDIHDEARIRGFQTT